MNIARLYYRVVLNTGLTYFDFYHQSQVTSTKLNKNIIPQPKVIPECITKVVNLYQSGKCYKGIF